jgi:flagellin
MERPERVGIRINTNIFSLLINRNLQRSSSQLETSYKRLSTGDKINQAGDDPAGLANSHALRAKIAGLQRNLINSNEGLNITNVAESGLSNITDILQRLTELAVQCSSETVNSDQRLLVQKEVDQQLAEIQRIATTANYNDKNLLDGTFANLRLQVGTRMDQSIPVSIRSAQTSTIGLTASVTGTSGVDANAIAGVGDLTINGQTVPASIADGISIVNNTSSAIAKAAAINSITNLTNVTATANPTVVSDATAAISAGAIDGLASTLTINGTSIGAITFLPNDSDGRLREKINSYSSLTGVTASLGANGQLVLTASDGRNVQVATTGSIADELGLRAGDGDINTVATGTVTLSSSDTIQVGGNMALLGLSGGQATTFVDPASAISNLNVTTSDNAQKALKTLAVAMQQILAQRADIGALEDRVSKTIDDLQLNIENLSGADSRIRDADFALETARLTQSQILQQAGIAILSQANNIPKMALDLLQK